MATKTIECSFRKLSLIKEREVEASDSRTISLEKIIRVLEANEPQVYLDLEFIENANKALKNMLELGK